VIAPPESVTVPSGSTVVFVCISLDVPSIIWRHEQEELNSIADPRVNISEGLVNKSGRVFLRSVLQLCGVSDVDAANYSCTADRTTDLAASTFTSLAATIPGVLQLRPKYEPTAIKEVIWLITSYCLMWKCL